MKKVLLLILSLFVSPAFASGINANSASAPCTNNTLETYSGNTNLQADWQPNTINIRWYNENERLSVQSSAQSCVYDGALTVPSTQPTRTGYTFAGWEVKYTIPAGYTELEYLESTGEQWIDTGVNFMYGDEFFFEYMPIGIVSSENKGYGADTSLNGGGRRHPNIGDIAMYANGNYFYIPRLPYGNTLGNRYIEHWNINTTSGVLSSVLTDVSNNLVYTFDGTGYKYDNTYQSRLTVYLYRDHEEIYKYPSRIRIYKVWLKRGNGTTAFNYVPARRNSDNVLGMYDTVTKTFFTNAGTGSFIAGPAVQ